MNDDDVEINEQDDLDSNVYTNVNPAHISIPEDFKDEQRCGPLVRESHKCTLYCLLYYYGLKVYKVVNDIVVTLDECGNANKSKGRVSVHIVYKLVPLERIMVPLNNLL